MRLDLIAQIDTENLIRNYHALRTRIGPNVKLCAILKADAYGHGIHTVAGALQEAGADWAAVATLQEAVDLRNLDWYRPILVLGSVLAVSDERERLERIRAILKYKATLTIVDRDTVDLLERTGLPSNIDVHVKIDTGMGRMGCLPEEAGDLIKAVRNSTNLKLTGVYSHFATADFEQTDLVRAQFERFSRLLTDLGGLLPPGTIRHLANSAATITMPEAHFDMVRPGLALFGYHPAEHMTHLIDLKPTLRLVSHLSAVKTLPAGHCVGYGQTFTTTRQTTIGLVPIGYFDGYVRALSNAAVVTTRHGDAPVIGRVSMDQLAIDLTDQPEARPGMEVILIQDRADRPNSVVSMAKQLNTIPYEITCLLGRRIQRVAVRGTVPALAPALSPVARRRRLPLGQADAWV